MEALSDITKNGVSAFDVGTGGGGGGTGDLLAANNLSDVDNTETALANLGGISLKKAAALAIALG